MSEMKKEIQEGINKMNVDDDTKKEWTEFFNKAIEYCRELRIATDAINTAKSLVVIQKLGKREIASGNISIITSHAVVSSLAVTNIETNIEVNMDIMKAMIEREKKISSALTQLMLSYKMLIDKRIQEDYGFINHSIQSFISTNDKFIEACQHFEFDIEFVDNL